MEFLTNPTDITTFQVTADNRKAPCKRRGRITAVPPQFTAV